MNSVIKPESQGYSDLNRRKKKTAGKLTQALIQQRFYDAICTAGNLLHHNIMCTNCFSAFPLAKPEISEQALGSNTELLQKRSSLMHVI